LYINLTLKSRRKEASVSTERNDRAQKHLHEITRIFHQKTEELRREVTIRYISDVILAPGFSDEDLDLARDIMGDLR
jgi:hypothetical protein